MIKRLFDIVCAMLGLAALVPVFVVIAIVVAAGSTGGVLYGQLRTGKHNVPFRLWKFRTMRTGADSGSLLTIGGRDSRITREGYYLRKYKLDELPQLFNVLAGDMSIVGPRPEVKKYTDMYSAAQRKVLQVKPGITDYASIEYRNENDLLAASSDPEATYVNEIMPKKLELNMRYLREQSLLTDVRIIFRTISKIISG